MWVVHGAAADGAGIADEDIGAGTSLKDVRVTSRFVTR
jgi:hypothetical protein